MAKKLDIKATLKTIVSKLRLEDTEKKLRNLSDFDLEGILLDGYEAGANDTLHNVQTDLNELKASDARTKARIKSVEDLANGETGNTPLQ